MAAGVGWGRGYVPELHRSPRTHVEVDSLHELIKKFTPALSWADVWPAASLQSRKTSTLNLIFRLFRLSSNLFLNPSPANRVKGLQAFHLAALFGKSPILKIFPDVHREAPSLELLEETFWLPHCWNRPLCKYQWPLFSNEIKTLNFSYVTNNINLLVDLMPTHPCRCYAPDQSLKSCQGH